MKLLLFDLFKKSLSPKSSFIKLILFLYLFFSPSLKTMHISPCTLRIHRSLTYLLDLRTSALCLSMKYRFWIYFRRRLVPPRVHDSGGVEAS
ncbi:Serine/threonine-protein kinase ksp1 [Fusarium oxysporum f. sp. albedinis]|nr:Serine/threonine-protein kinase ksp1 [Fusarium oxysporum f. sp. albedinis]